MMPFREIVRILNHPSHFLLEIEQPGLGPIDLESLRQRVRLPTRLLELVPIESRLRDARPRTGREEGAWCAAPDAQAREVG